jgi:hypothetical protein
MTFSSPKLTVIDILAITLNDYRGLITNLEKTSVDFMVIEAVGVGEGSMSGKGYR